MRKMRERNVGYVRICPNCGSTNVYSEGRYIEWGPDTSFVCKNCGFLGIFPEVKETEIEEFRKELREKHGK